MKHLFVLIFITLLLTACSSTQDKLQGILQTTSASKIKKDYKKILTSLVIFKEKLNARNPKNYNIEHSKNITKSIKTLANNVYLEVNNKKLERYSEYLKYAFDKNKNTVNRNDLLILGLYKLIYEAYDIKAGHQITALSYDIKKLQKLYYNLNVIKWRIKSNKDESNTYLFLTWQKNWQIELKKNINSGKTPTWEMIQNLEYIKNKKESIFDSSNLTFEVLLSKMIYHVRSTLKNVGEEPIDVSIEAMKSLVIFL